MRLLFINALIALAALTASAAAHAQEPEISGAPGGILFLHLKVGTNGVALVSSGLRPGRFKGEAAKGAIEFELGDAAGRTLFTSRTPDPLVERLEFESSDEPGKILVKEVRRQSAEFTIRVPKKEGAKVMRFFRRAPVVPGQLPRQAASREFLGAIQIPEQSER